MFNTPIVAGLILYVFFAVSFTKFLFDGIAQPTPQSADTNGTVIPAKPGNPVIPLGIRIPIDNLPPGSYRAEIKAMDSAGNTTKQRTAEFEVE